MVDILLRNVTDDMAKQLKERAAASGRSISETAQDLLAQHLKPSRAELLEEARRIRAMSPYSDVDSTDLIREDRDNDEPYR